MSVSIIRLIMNHLVLLFVGLSVQGVSSGQTKDGPLGANAVGCTLLRDAVASATASSEFFKIQQADAAASAEQYNVAKAAMLPTIKAAAQIVKQDNSQVTAKSGVESFPTTAKIALSQPLYAGGAEYAALRKTSQLAEASSKQFDGARIKVARDVVAKSYQLLMAEFEYRSTTELQELSRRRLKSIQARVAIGRSKATDKLGAEVQVANSDAQVEASKLALEASRRQVSSMIGKDVASICETPSKDQATVKTWDDVRRKVWQRPDILAAEMSIAAAREGVLIARSGNQLSLDLGGNYYLRRPETQKSFGRWDTTLSATLPIYSGGMVSAKVNEAMALEQRKLAEGRQIKQLAEDEARDLWEVFAHGRAQVIALEVAAKKAEIYYQLVSSDERKGLASSLETLQALNASIDAQRAAMRAKLKHEEVTRQLYLVMGDLQGAIQ